MIVILVLDFGTLSEVIIVKFRVLNKNGQASQLQANTML